MDPKIAPNSIDPTLEPENIDSTWQFHLSFLRNGFNYSLLGVVLSTIPLFDPPLCFLVTNSLSQCSPHPLTQGCSMGHHPRCASASSNSTPSSLESSPPKSVSLIFTWRDFEWDLNKCLAEKFWNSFGSWSVVNKSALD